MMILCYRTNTSDDESQSNFTLQNAFLTEGKVGASSSVDSSGVTGSIGVAHGDLGPLGAIGEIGTGGGSHTGGVLEGRNSGHVQSAPGNAQSGVNVVVAVGVVGAGSGADTGGPYLLGGSRGHGNQSQKRCLKKVKSHCLKIKQKSLK